MKQQVAAGEFKVKCLHLLDEVNRSRRELIITKRGKPVARVVPMESAQASLLGRMRGSVEIIGDIVGPTGERWEADE